MSTIMTASDTDRDRHTAVSMLTINKKAENFLAFHIYPDKAEKRGSNINKTAILCVPYRFFRNIHGFFFIEIHIYDRRYHGV